MSLRQVILGLTLCTLIAGVLVSCGSEVNMGNPREVVMGLFNAMNKNDEAALTRLLDIQELMRNSQEDYAIQKEDARVFTSPEEVLKDLTGDGETKSVWFAHQRIVGNAKIMGETATVFVTFNKTDGSRGYMTKFGLNRKQGNWRIYSFKTFTE